MTVEDAAPPETPADTRAGTLNEALLAGTAGTLSSYDFEPTVGVQTRERREITQVPVDVLAAPYRNPVEYVLYCKSTGTAISGPLDPAMCRVAQRIIDTAVASARAQRTLDLLP